MMSVGFLDCWEAGLSSGSSPALRTGKGEGTSYRVGM